MADYYTNFSVVLPLKDESQKQYALALHKEAVAIAQRDGEPIPKSFPESLETHLQAWCFDTDKNDEGVWLHSQSGGQDAACVFIQHLLQKFEFAGGVTFEWSHDCSKPRTDAFGGGAAFITATKIKTFTTQQWLLQIVGKRKHDIDPDSLCCTKCGKRADDVEQTICLP